MEPFCPTCENTYRNPGWLFCSDSFHRCRNCTWINGAITKFCSDHYSENKRKLSMFVKKNTVETVTAVIPNRTFREMVEAKVVESIAELLHIHPSHVDLNQLKIEIYFSSHVGRVKLANNTEMYVTYTQSQEESLDDKPKDDLPKFVTTTGGD